MAPQPQPHPKLQCPARTSLRFPPVRANGIAWHGVTCSHGMYHVHERQASWRNRPYLGDPKAAESRKFCGESDPRPESVQTAAMRTGMRGDMIWGCYLSDLKSDGECYGALELCAPLSSKRRAPGKVCM